MKTSPSALDRLKHEIKLKDFFERNADECAFRGAEAIYDLFDPYLSLIQEQITKPHYELGIDAHFFDRIVSDNIQTIVELTFSWEPLTHGYEFEYHEATFSSKHRRMIQRYIQEFSIKIGMIVEIANE